MQQRAEPAGLYAAFLLQGDGSAPRGPLSMAKGCQDCIKGRFMNKQKCGPLPVGGDPATNSHPGNGCRNCVVWWSCVSPALPPSWG